MLDYSGESCQVETRKPPRCHSGHRARHDQSESQSRKLALTTSVPPRNLTSVTFRSAREPLHTSIHLVTLSSPLTTPHLLYESKMHHLHPRSRTTSTLFTTTLAISFLVVGVPHILPCPVDRRQFADAVEVGPDGKRRRRRRRVEDEKGAAEETSTAGGGLDASGDGSAGRPARECPVPKPGGLVGQIMGFERQQQERERSVQVVVEGMRERRTRTEAEDTGKGGEAR